MLLKGLSYLEKIKCKNKNSPNEIDELVNLLEKLSKEELKKIKFLILGILAERD